MRIIGGKYRGRRLVNFTAEHIRPTTDRVKESWFNILQGSWEGAHVLDLFSGTGNLSFEALSRGALQVTAVEDNPKSLAIILKNQELLKIEKKFFRAVKKDVLKFLSDYDRESFDIIMIDPPFTEKLAHKTLEILSASKVFGPSSIVGIESGSHERLDDSYGPLQRSDQRNYGDKLLSFFTC